MKKFCKNKRHFSVEEVKGIDYALIDAMEKELKRLASLTEEQRREIEKNGASLNYSTNKVTKLRKNIK